MIPTNLKTDPEFLELLAASKRAVDAMTPAEREEMHRVQRESWVRGEMGIGNDADEARARAEYRRNRQA